MLDRLYGTLPSPPPSLTILGPFRDRSRGGRRIRSQRPDSSYPPGEPGAVQFSVSGLVCSLSLNVSPFMRLTFSLDSYLADGVAEHQQAVWVVSAPAMTRGQGDDRQVLWVRGQGVRISVLAFDKSSKERLLG